MVFKLIVVWESYFWEYGIWDPVVKNIKFTKILEKNQKSFKSPQNFLKHHWNFLETTLKLTVTDRRTEKATYRGGTLLKKDWS